MEKQTLEQQIGRYFACIRVTTEDGEEVHQTGLVIAKTKTRKDKIPLKDILVLTFATKDRKSKKMDLLFDHEDHTYEEAHFRFDGRPSPGESGIITLSLDASPKQYEGLDHFTSKGRALAAPDRGDYIIWRVVEESMVIEKIILIDRAVRRIQFNYPSQLDTQDKRSKGVPKTIDAASRKLIEEKVIAAAIFKTTGRFVGFVRQVDDKVDDMDKSENIFSVYYHRIEDMKKIVESSK